MGLFGFFKRDNGKNQNIQNMLPTDYEMEYNSLLGDIVLLTNELKKEFEKHTYYLAMNRLLYKAGVERAEMFIDYHAGRVLELERTLKRLLRIVGNNPDQLIDIVKMQRQKAWEDIQQTNDILNILEYQNMEIEKIESMAAKNEDTNSGEESSKKVKSNN